jgi:hypothetical protein
VLEDFARAETFGDVAHFQQDSNGRRGNRLGGRRGGHWAALTSFQISMYLARRGTSCQK